MYGQVSFSLSKGRLCCSAHLPAQGIRNYFASHVLKYICEIRNSHRDDYAEYWHQGCDTV
jgi:hypothetical protein